MGRIFTYGCSFTNYVWPTWADLLLHGNEGFNFGNMGSGTVQIMNKIIHTDTKIGFKEDDIVIIILPTKHRWDYISGEESTWSTDGRIENNVDFDLTNEKYYTLDGLEYLSNNAVIAIKNFLENKKITHYIGGTSNSFKDIINYDLLNFSKFIHNDDLGMSWKTTKRWSSYPDLHPRVTHHYKWLNEILLPKLKNIELNVSEEDISDIEKMIDEFDTTLQCFTYFKNKTKYFENKVTNKINFELEKEKVKLI